MISRSLFAAALLASTGWASPPLTTIQDILYKADGTRFAGTVTISWTSFEAIDQSAITTQVVTVRVIEGNFRVQLVPTTTAVPAAYYAVKYNSDGRIQFSETWAVPSSVTPLRIRDVRIAAGQGNTVGSDTNVTSVVESSVAGLVADLGARPVKGLGYAAGRVTVVDSSGLLESVTGSPSDCVHVDGSTAPCGGGSGSGSGTSPVFVDGDSPSGIVDGSNTSFTLSAVPQPISSLSVYRNGVLQKLLQDYNVTGNVVQFVSLATPQPGDTLIASYRLTATDSGALTNSRLMVSKLAASDLTSNTTQTFPASQVLCSGVGTGNTTATFASLGLCNIPAGVLVPGDRVQVFFDADHQGTAGGFTIEVNWGGTTMLHRDAGALDIRVTGRTTAAILNSGAQLSSESWGTLLPFTATVAGASDAYDGGVAVTFQGRVIHEGETVTLRNYTVVRLP